MKIKFFPMAFSLIGVSCVMGWTFLGYASMKNLQAHAHDGAPVTAKPEPPPEELKHWQAVCDEPRRVRVTLDCMMDYYNANEMKDSSAVIKDREAFDMCRANAVLAYCNWEEK